ncbi:hemin uptake protein HemP [Pulveribacter suum]|uniref:Hemin uptake protein HemP n=1 Tax=Pulveribacter suum TaxID=2116657 RepID=A0A2P1NM61_9BURK|nr:hemin uptake protein HemP [Pulveribacter suum]AVP58145.1 hemin uptake protein HemP [Pulveribacter suum]
MHAVLAAQPALPATPPALSAGVAASERPALHSSALLQGCKAVTIVHNGALYQLQATRLGKLILTK